MGSSTVRTLAKISGSWRLTHISFGAVKPGMAMLPVTRSLTSLISAASAADRPSFHRMQGRSTLSASSSSVAPCIWPERPMPLTAAISAR